MPMSPFLAPHTVHAGHVCVGQPRPFRHPLAWRQGRAWLSRLSSRLLSPPTRSRSSKASSENADLGWGGQARQGADGWASWGAPMKGGDAPGRERGSRGTRQGGRGTGGARGASPRGAAGPAFPATLDDSTFSREFEAFDDDFLGDKGALGGKGRRSRGSPARRRESGFRADFDADTWADTGEAGSGSGWDTGTGAWADAGSSALPRPQAERQAGAVCDIELLTREEADLVLPLAPLGTQVKFYTKALEDNVQRVGASLAAAIILSKVVLLAATAATFPLWSPWAQAAARNLSVKKAPHVGLWRARVLEIDWPSETPPRGGRGGWTRAASLRVVVGDDAGAEAEVEVPMRRAYDRLRAGEPALLLVVSSTPSMKRFSAVKDVYLPQSRVWLADYPFIDRGAFLSVLGSLERG